MRSILVNGKLSRIVVLILFAVSLLLTAAANPVYAAPGVCTWLGTTDTTWSTATNWDCGDGLAPESGDSLVFPEVASNKSNFNDIPSMTVTEVMIAGSGYTLAGNQLTITTTGGLTADSSATVNMAMSYSSSNMYIQAGNGTTLTLNGETNFSPATSGGAYIGDATHTGTVDFVGAITGDLHGSSRIIAQDGATAIARGANTVIATWVGAESGGVFECRSATCFGDSANTIYMGDGEVSIYVMATFANGLATSTSSPGVSKLTTDTDVAISGNATITDDLRIEQTAADAHLQLNGNVTLGGFIDTYGVDNTTSEVEFGGVVSGPGTGGFNVRSGETSFYGTNTFSGGVWVKNGASVKLFNASGLGNPSDSTIVENNGSLVLGDFNSPTTVIVPENIQIVGSGSGSLDGAILNDSNENYELSGDITLNGNARIHNPELDSTVILSGVIDGMGDLNLEGQWNSLGGGADIELDGASPNTFTGDTVVTGGAVYFQKSGAIPGDLRIENDDTPSGNRSSAYFYNSSTVMSDTGVIYFGSGDYNVITFGEDNEVIGGLSGAEGEVDVQTNGDRVIVDQNFDSTYGGTFYTDGNMATIEKRGSGKLTLTGDYQFIADQITFDVTGGVLAVNSTLRTTDGGHVTVNGGTLQGTGTVNGLTTVGGTVRPGNSPGKLSVSTLTLDASSNLVVELDGPVAGTQYDQIESVGVVDLGNATLTIVPGYTPASGQVFTIITGSSITGTFNGLVDGAMVTVSGMTYRINYNATSVTLTYVDEAASVAASLADTGQTALPSIISGLLLIAAAIVLLARRSIKV